MFEDEGYRWCEDVVEKLPARDAEAFLLRDAREEINHQEWEIAYQILRELVWRFPRNREGWCLLSEMAAHLGKHEEAAEARKRGASEQR